MNANDRQVGGDHYRSGFQHWDLTLMIPLGYFEGTITKYVSRWRKKNGLEDLKKAMHYLDKLLEVPDYDIPPRLITGVDIETTISRFAIANNLVAIEEEIILLLCSYKSTIDLVEAHCLLEELMENAEAQGLEFPHPEVAVPGTPEDGGHHAENKGG